MALSKEAALLAAIRLRAAKERPYFSTALFALKLVPLAGLGTTAIDRYGRVYVDTTIIGPGKKWTIPQAAWALVHELGHWLREHHRRAAPLIEAYPTEEREDIARRVNDAEDAELNDDADAEGWDLPGNYYTPQVLAEQYGVPLEDHKLFEVYWQAIRDKVPPPIYIGWAVEGAPEQGCGSGADGVPRDYELGEPGGDTPGIREAEGDLLRVEVARQIRAEASRKPGSVPGGWARWADTLLEAPEVPWERELAALARNAYTMARGQIDYSYDKPGRMFNGVIMPTMVRPEPHVGVEIDTSGSMQKGDLQRALSEMQGILRSVGQRRCPVVCVDAAVQTVQVVSSAFDIELKGGGGTDMGVGIEQLVEMGVKVIVVLTDGYTPWPERLPPAVELVVGVIGSKADTEGFMHRAPKYAKRVLRIPTLEEEQEAA